VQPLAVERLESSFFENQRLFPAGSVEFYCALLMRGIEHEWHRRGRLCAGYPPSHQADGSPASFLGGRLQGEPDDACHAAHSDQHVTHNRPGRRLRHAHREMPYGCLQRLNGTPVDEPPRCE
jgi:hypothetical protein